MRARVEVSKNLFDEQWEVGSFDTNTGVNLSVQDRKRTKNLIEIKPNTAYTFSTNYGVDVWGMFYDSNMNIDTGITGVSKYQNSYNLRNKTITTSANTKYVKFYVPVWHDDLTVMLNEGSTALPYEPYGKYLVPKFEGRVEISPNLFNVNGMTVPGYANGATFNTHNTAKTYVIPCEPNTTYTFYADETDERITAPRSSLTTWDHIPTVNGDNTGTRIYGNNNRQIHTGTFKTNSSAKYILWWLSLYGNDIPYIKNIMLNEGSTALPYEPYGKRIVPYLTGRVELSLPSGYTERENLSFTRTGATLTIPKTLTDFDRWDFDIQFNEGGRCLIGWTASDRSGFFGKASSSNNYDGASVSGANERHIFTHWVNTSESTYGYDLEGVNILKKSMTVSVSGNSLVIPIYSYLGPGFTVWSIKAYKDGVLGAHYLPATNDSTSAVGFYDIISKTFYSGTNVDAGAAATNPHKQLTT